MTAAHGDSPFSDIVSVGCAGYVVKVRSSVFSARPSVYVFCVSVRVGGEGSALSLSFWPRLPRGLDFAGFRLRFCIHSGQHFDYDTSFNYCLKILQNLY